MENIRLKAVCFFAVVFYTVCAFSQIVVSDNILYRINKNLYTASVLGLCDKSIQSQYDLKIPNYIKYNSEVFEVNAIEDGAFQNDVYLTSVSFVPATVEIDDSLVFGDGTADKPYLVSQLLTLFNSNNVPSNEIYFKGIVAKIKEVSTDFGCATYYLSDDGKDSNTFYVYRSKYLNNTKFTSTDQLQVGDIVIVYGKVTLYINTPETEQNNSYLYWTSRAGGQGDDGGKDGDIPTVSSIDNGGFETWMDDKTPENWKTASSAGNATLSQSADAHSGNYSVCVTGMTSANKRLAYKEINLEAGTYTMTFYAKAESATACVRPGYVPVTNGTVGTYVYGEYTSEITSSEWVKITHEFLIERGTTLSLVILNSKNPGGNVLIDDVSLTKHPSVSSSNENAGTKGYIGASAFSGCSGLTSIKIPNSVTSIGEYAFSECYGLTSIEIPNSVTDIGSSAFYHCSGLTSIKIPNSVTSIGERAFYRCSGLTSITIPNSVTSIGEYAFSECYGLTSVTIPNSVTSINDYAFSGCSGLTSVSIPNSVTNIGRPAFYHCNNVSYIYWDTNVSPSCLTQYCNKTLKTVVLGDNITSIGSSAFSGCSSLTSIEIPNSVTSIGNYAFRGCSSLTSIEIPNSVTSIGEYAFSECYGLTSVTIPNSVTSIGKYAFQVCGNIESMYWDSNVSPHCLTQYCELKTLVLGDNITSIGNYAFYSCSGLTSIEIPNSVTSIGDYAFYSCSGLTSIEIPNSITSIGEYAFSECYGLTSVTIPNSLTSIGNSAFSYCGRLTSIEIPNSVTNIGENAFSGCSGLTSIVIPNSVTSIGGSAFYHCSSLTSVEIPNSVTKIGGGAFCYCTSLTSVTIPNSVTEIAQSAFSSCENLASVTIFGSATKIGSSAFSSCRNLASVTISGSIIEIGANAFWGCNCLTSIDIPNSVTSIGQCAFYGCSGLTSIDIPNSVTSIGSSAFEGCKNLDKVFLSYSKPISVDHSIFDGVYVDGWIFATLYVPYGTKEMYELVSPWKCFYKIEEYDAAGIENVKMDVPKGEKVYYNLNGQRVNNPTNGIYILNGKKVLIK